MPQFLQVSAILFFSSVIQGTVGFASGLFAIPLLLMAGMGLPESVMINLMASLVQSTTGAYQLRRKIDPRRTIRPIVIRLLTMPIGIYAMERTESWRQSQVTQIIGIVLLATVLLQWAWRVKPRARLHWGWDYLAFSTSGFMAGFCGMGGPPMVLWVMAHNWPMNRARALLYFLFVTGMPPQAFIMWLMFGNKILGAMLLGLAALPALLAGLYLGLWFSRLMSDRVLRRLSWVMLVLIALSAIVMPYVT